MTWLRALRWSTLIFTSLFVLATACWLVTGDGSFDIGVTFALIPNLLLALFLAYRLVRAGIGELMPFGVGVLATVPALMLGWSAFQGLRLRFGKQIGPLPVERYAKLKDRNAVITKLYGRMLWKQGINFNLTRGGSKTKYTLLPFVPVQWQPGDPVHVWLLGTRYRYKRADFDGCGYPKSVPCTVTVYEPNIRELRLRLIRRGQVPKVGGLDFVVLRADFDRGWLPRRLALGVGPAWFVLLTLWIWRLGRKSARRRAEEEQSATDTPERKPD